MSKVSSRPPLKTIVAQQETKELTQQFIRDGDFSNAKQEPILYPWQAGHVREDVIKVFNLRIPEPYFLKLEYLSKQTRLSKQSICLDAITSVIDQEINNM